MPFGAPFFLIILAILAQDRSQLHQPAF